jgi:hypothetical protein
MKPKIHLFACVIFFFVNLSLYAQDKDMTVIKLKSGEEIKAKIISFSSDEIEYKSYYVQQGPSLKITLSQISYVINPDGTKELYDTPVVASSPAASTTISTPPTIYDDHAQDLKKSIDNLNAKMQDLSNGQQQQTKALADALKTLNETVISLKTTLEQGGIKTTEQNQQVLDKLSTLNNSVKDLKEATTAATGKDEIKVRKFGFAVNILADVNTNIFNYKDDQTNTTSLAQTITSLSKIGNGFGLSAVVNTGVDKKVGFRFEPELNFAELKANVADKDGDTTSVNFTYFSLSTNFFACIHNHRTNIYVGPALSFGVMHEGDNSDLYTPNYFVFGTGLRFGGEYLIDSHFSIGVETGINYSAIINPSGYGDKVTGMLSIPSKVVGRFYF